MIVCRYLTNRPELLTAQELIDLTKRITYLYRHLLSQNLIYDRSVGESFSKSVHTIRNRRSTYTHPRVRSAYLSLRRNMMWLLTFEEYEYLHIPKTNNAIEGTFTDIKTKLRVHSGISKQRRITLIQELITRIY